MTGTPLPEGGARFQRTLTTPKIVFIIIAAAAPLAAMLFTVPLAFAIGTGPGVPAMFLFAGLTLLCFSAGYAAIARRITHMGGFYTHIAHGLGRRAAAGSGLLAVLAYNAATVGVLGAFAYFTQGVAAAHGLDLPWQVWAGAGLLLVALLGYREAEISARLLSVCMVCEIAILVALDIAVLARHGGAALPSASFAPHDVFAPGLGVSVMFGFASFLGFESAALYGEEAKAPHRSVPRATVVAVLAVASFYALTSWVAVGALGPERVRAQAGSHLGDLFFLLSDSYLGHPATVAMQVLLCTSLFASWLALHNAANRYMYALGRDGLMPAGLHATRGGHGSVHRASVVQTVFSAVVVTLFAAAGLDPYVNMSTSMLGLGTLGIILLQALASVAVVGYFRRRRAGRWQTVVAPALGALGLITAAVLVVSNFDVLTGTTEPAVTALPWLLLLAGVLGVALASWLRSARPDRYARLGGASVPAPAPRAPAGDPSGSLSQAAP
ncbi:APC family permease [Streptomyces rubradiris]|uniref:Amino acid permease n=1 Tax=Streptomyces rubradiris TaxID=285531 RepID=A0ABQ3RR73_STRRR|nr:APC family permease [Streptomyces rubradiris]GHH24629.1 amino acid permease [Streptomyces rubradiris]GHI58277.1 amino acid permease [Streptomyces rubradiris]